MGITMGLIRESKNVDFTVLDKPWTDRERKELSAYIKIQKEKLLIKDKCSVKSKK